MLILKAKKREGIVHFTQRFHEIDDNTEVWTKFTGLRFLGINIHMPNFIDKFIFVI